MKLHIGPPGHHYPKARTVSLRNTIPAVQKPQFGDWFVFTGEKTDENGAQHLYYDAIMHPETCECCGHETSRIHTSCTRTLQDVPRNGAAVYYHFRLYTYVCTNPDCHVRTFVQVLPFAGRNQRRTLNLDRMLLACVATSASYRAASRCVAHMGGRVSHDAIVTLVAKTEISDDPTVEEIGVDDIAIRKGQTYVTVIYNAKTGHVLAILPGRDGHPLKEWLRVHPNVKKVARDGSLVYASAITAEAEGATQVSDRFHMYKTMSKSLRKCVRKELPATVWVKGEQIVDPEDPETEMTTRAAELMARKPDLHYDGSAPLDEDGRNIAVDAQIHLADQTDTAAREAAKRCAVRYQRALAIREQHTQHGMSVIELAKQFNEDPAQIRRLLDMSPEETEALRKPTRRKPDASPVGNTIYKMMADGHDNDTVCAYLATTQPSLTASQIDRRVTAVQINHFPERQRLGEGRAEWLMTSIPAGADEITALKLSYYLLTREQNRKSEDAFIAAALPAIREAYPCVTEVEKAYADFDTMIKGGRREAVDEFIRAYRTGFLKSFCTGLNNDREAVKNAVTEELSSGFVEGSNNKAKVIKRAGYGRDGIESLGRKCNLAFLSTKSPGIQLISLVRYPIRKRPSQAA